MKKTIWSSDLDYCESVWQNVYMVDGRDIHKPLEVKWNWLKFDYQYTFTVIK